MGDQLADIPPRNGSFTLLFIDSYSESSHVADQVVDIPPNGNFRFLLIDSYFERSDVTEQVADIPPKNGSFTLLFIDSYS